MRRFLIALLLVATFIAPAFVFSGCPNSGGDTGKAGEKGGQVRKNPKLDDANPPEDGATTAPLGE